MSHLFQAALQVPCFPLCHTHFQADSLQVAHTHASLQLIWKGEVKLEFLLAGDSGALPQVLGTCASWQEEVISSFLSAFYPAFASPLIRVAKGR